MGIIFFDPDKEMIQWLIDEVLQNRTLFDIGCGTGELLMRLKENDYHKLVGVDPFTDYHEFMKNNMERNGDRIHFFPYEVQDPSVMKLIMALPKDTGIGFLCRPCHSYFLTKETYDIFKTAGIPLYYIGLEENLEQDLEQYDIPYTQLIHKGTSKDNEKVYRLV